MNHRPDILMKQTNIRGFCTFSLIALLQASMVHAERMEDLLRKGPRLSSAVTTEDSAAKSAVSQKSGKFPHAIVRTDALTGDIASIQFDLREMPRKESLTAAIKSGQAIAKEFSEEFSFQEGEWTPLSLEPVSLGPNLFVLSYQRNVHGRPVRDASFDVLVTGKDGGFFLREIRAQTFGDVPLVQTAKKKWNSSDLATKVGMKNIEIIAQRPIYMIVTEDESSYGWIAASEVSFRSLDEPDHSYTVWMNDITLQPVMAQSHKVHAAQLKHELYDRSYLDGARTHVEPARKVTLAASGETFQTSSLGYLPAEKVGPMQMRVSSDRYALVDAAAANQPINIAFDAAADGEIKPQASGSGALALNALGSLERINMFVRTFLKASDSLHLTKRIDVSINVAGSCNAFYNGSISLYGAGGGCANMATVNDVIYHEWGHGLDDYTGRQRGIRDGAFSEGIGDIVAALYAQSSNMGQGFFQGQITGIRQLKNSKRYPQDRGAVHDEGEIIGGTFWDLNLALIERYGETHGRYLASELFFRHLQISDTYLESYANVLLLDDDDANPVTRSPHHCIINKAFADHGLAQPENCSDAPVVRLGVVNEGFRLAYRGEGENARISVAIPVEKFTSAKSLKLCTGLVPTCAGTTKEFALTVDGEKNGLVFLDSAPGTLLSEHDLLSLATVDEAGKVLEYRRFKLGLR